jgi:2',3'-cyclic-nucleotide 2'-phosphodiesterase
MKILVIGDIFGKVGRKVLKNHLPNMKKEKDIDLVIANVENATHGKGISFEHYQELKSYGVDLMTSGNHIFHLDNTKSFINEVSDLLRPLNWNPYHPGVGTTLKTIKGKKIRLTNLIGNIFMPTLSENPFYPLEKILIEKDWDIHLVDFHAEASAEKISLALHFDGQISALWGTHTHVQTADERILTKGTGFITDVGLTGPRGGVIGAELKGVIERYKYGLPGKIIPKEKDGGQINAIILEFDKLNNQLLKIERIFRNF